MYVRYIKYFYLLNISVYLCGKIHLRLCRTAVAPKIKVCVRAPVALSAYERPLFCII